MSGLAGRFFTPLGLTYVYATLASLVVAVTVTPALCLVLLGDRELPDRDPFLVRWLKKRYRFLLEEVNLHPRGVMAAVAVLIVFGLGLLPFFGGGFLPEFTEGHFVVHMNLAPGAALPESIALGSRVARELLKLPSVRSVSQWAGRAAKSDDIVGTHFNEFDVDFKQIQSEAEFQSALSELRRVFARFPGASFDTKTFLTERIEDTFSGFTASVVVNIFGRNLELLDQKAQEVSRVLSSVPGATEVLIQSPPGTPQLAVRLRPEALSFWGFDALEVLDAVNTAYSGEVVGQVYDGNQVVDVSVILEPKIRRSIAAVGALPFRNATGTYVRLRQLADIFESSGRYVILHEGARRVQAVTCNVAGRDLNSFTAEAKKKILASVSFPVGTYLSFTGAAAGQARSRQDLLVHSLIAGVGLILLLSMVIGNWRNLVLVLVNLPFALVGGVLAVFVSGGWLSIGSMVGFVTLFGITLRNSIMLISHFEHLVVKEGQSWGPETAIRGALERMSPILMTALVTALGLLPLAIGSGAPGREIEGPMALVILGGLLTSTLLNLLVLPVLALRYGKFEAPAAQD
jgi:Cu/Ag efflux pump CusA